jgi:ATP/maltotriose-dependent transcriptional regulator MalT
VPDKLAHEFDELLRLDGATAGERTALTAVAYVLAKEVAPAGDVVELLERAIRGGGCSFLDGPPGYFPFTLIAPLSWAGRIRRAVELENSLLEEARSAGSVLWHIETCAARAFSQWYGGSLRDAEADARDALAASDAHRLPFYHYPLANGALVNALTEQGRLDDALIAAEQFEFPAERDDSQFSAVRDAAHARLEIALGRYDEALTRLAAAGDTLTRSGTLIVEVCPWRELTAHALIALDRLDEAGAILAPALDAARRFGGPLGLGTTLRTAALIGRPANVDLLREAVAVLEPSEIRLEHARALVDLGATLRRLGYRQDARTPLAEGLEMAHRCGAAPLTERARTELAATGARPRRVERSGTDSLTASELRVAQLAAAGLSNREIAQQLFVTMRTISTHLTHTYTKLGIERRDQLASTLTG